MRRKPGTPTLFVRYFGTDDLGSVSEAMLASRLDRIRVDFGMKQVRGQRFALWALMHTLGVTPDLDGAFKDKADRGAARTLIDIAGRAKP